MALSIHEAASIIGAPDRVYRNKSSLPHCVEDCMDFGGHVECDYDWEQDDPDDAPSVAITAIRMVMHDGTEFPVPLRSVNPRWLTATEAVISDDVAAYNEACALSLKGDGHD